MKQISIFSLILLTFCCSFSAGSVPSGISCYKQKPSDSDAIYFTSENYHLTSDGKSDISDKLQGAIDKLKLENSFGIIFIPEGTYLISKTIYIPGAIRLIGYGAKRPLIVLKKNSPGYQAPVLSDKGKANYMFWFTSTVVEQGKPVNDAGAGTFYSSLSNIDLKIEDGNPEAVALRTHFAQHSFISHCDIFIGKGKAGLFDVGNEMEDVRFFGGDYGIYTTKASPGWQFMMLDTYFEGQRKAAVKTQQAGLTILRMMAVDVPAVVKIDSGYWEKLYMEDCSFVNVNGPAISFYNEDNANMQINLRNISCKNVQVPVRYMKSNRMTTAPSSIYKIKNFTYGLQMNDLDSLPAIATTSITEDLKVMPPPQASDIVSLPQVETWFNIKQAGAKGDGETDDTKAIQNAIDNHQTIYFPQGLYRITETLKLKSNTIVVGLHPIGTQIVLAECTGSFSGFGAPVPMIEAPSGGANIISGIGISTGEYNYRACACKWMASGKSLMEDVKFVGGHGSAKKGPYTPWGGYGNQLKKPIPVPGPDPAWDTQYWSLWITNGGGGIFKNIWTASTYATSGIFVSNTSEASRIYAMSVEHHVRNEVRFSNVSNWKIYALQLEEESRESQDCQPMELCRCGNLLFANLYMFRVIRVKTPFPYSVRTWDCRNIELLNVHNYSQVKYTTDNPLYDINTNTEVRPVEFARLFISGAKRKNYDSVSTGNLKNLAKGFEFAEGMCSDSKGNIYFCEQRMKRIYKWSAESNSLTLLGDYPWEPLSLGCDAKDNLLVVCRYNPQPGFIVNGEQEKFSNPPDASGTSFSMWGNSGFTTLAYSINPGNPDDTFKPMQKASKKSVAGIHKALYPSNRWRDFHDFNKVAVNRSDECFVAPDGVTIIPLCYDLARSCGLNEAIPGRYVYACDEYDKRTVRMNVDSLGYLFGLTSFAEKGEFSALSDKKGDIYIADGEVYIFDSDGNQKGMIRIPERPSAIAFGGKDGNTLFVAGRSTLYSY